MACDSDLKGSIPWSPNLDQHQVSKDIHSYSPSTASTTSSTSDSAFSIDAPSSQSSESSESWPAAADHSSWPNDPEDQYTQNSHGSLQVQEEEIVAGGVLYVTSRGLKCSQAVAPESRQHPRRTRRLDSYNSHVGQLSTACAVPPPSLVRQSERKDNFVDSLVDTTTQMIETIWPLSVLSCARDAGLSGKQQNLIGLRTFVQEVLKRSKTSYSTLQVALYYLILIQSCLPKYDFTMEQSEDSLACRAMQCGRRMFLAALILASKYLQDRNYSARAWSKISGLKTCEINSNELAFLSAVNWKLHIPEKVFHRWTDIVLKYSPSAQVNACPRSFPLSPRTWKKIIPILTPELDLQPVPFGSGELFDGPEINLSSPVNFSMRPPATPAREDLSPYSTSDEPTPTNPYTIAPTLEPTPRDAKSDGKKLPPLPHLGLLPTPQMTPQIGTFCTPAVSASGACTGGSMGLAMHQLQKSCLARSTLDNPHQWKLHSSAPGQSCSRRSSLALSASSVSSPDSIASDASSRTSRSSSISSIASSNCALPPPRLAMQATRRCANMQLCGLKEENQKPMSNDEKSCRAWGLDGRSRKGSYPEPQMHEVSPQAAGYFLSYPSEDTREAAKALRDLHLNRQRMPPESTTVPRQEPSLEPTVVPRPQKGCKRSRPNSMDFSVQSCVRDMIAPRCLGDITNNVDRKVSTVLPDVKRADSFLIPKTSNSRLSSSHSNTKPALSGECLPRKRTCAGSDRGGKEEARLMMQKLKDRIEGPGMWDGII